MAEQEYEYDLAMTWEGVRDPANPGLPLPSGLYPSPGGEPAMRGQFEVYSDVLPRVGGTVELRRRPVGQWEVIERRSAPAPPGPG